MKVFSSIVVFFVMLTFVFMAWKKTDQPSNIKKPEKKAAATIQHKISSPPEQSWSVRENKPASPEIKKNEVPSAEQSQSRQLAVQEPMEQVKNFVESGDLVGAIEILKDQIRQNPEDAILRAELGAILLYRQDKPSEAFIQFRKAFELNPDHGLIAQSLVDAAIASGKKQEVERLLKEYLEANQGHAISQYALSDLQMKSGQYEKAVRIIRQSEKSSGETAGSENALAFAYLGKKDYRRSAQYFGNVVESQLSGGVDFSDEQQVSELIGNMGFHIESLVASHQNEKAQEELTRLIGLYPNHPEVKKIQAYYSEKLKQVGF